MASGLLVVAVLAWSLRRPPATTLLFLAGRAASPLSDGGALWADREGGRVVRFDRRGIVRAMLQGTPPGGPPLSAPLFAFAVGDEVWVAQGDGSVLRFVDDTPVAWLGEPLPLAPSAVTHGALVAARTTDEFGLLPLAPDEPLLRLYDTSGAPAGRLGTVSIPANPLLGQLSNAGWVTVDADGIYFVSALTPAIRRYSPGGRLEWLIRRPLAERVAPPVLRSVRGSPAPHFTLVHRAATVGPDGRLYVLGADHIYVFAPNGRLERERAVTPHSAVFADREGRLTVLPADSALARTGERLRVPFPLFVLPALDGRDTLRLEDYRGHVVVLTFWASWCGPCRRELPALDALRRELDTAGVAVLGLNEDANPDDARRFLAEIGVHLPSAEGRGQLRARYGYRGLPYTLVLDRELRVARIFYGFGESAAAVREAVLAESRR
ncbi:MAG: redoxin domain-containing protein [Gemmatimonadales bacterium]